MPPDDVPDGAAGWIDSHCHLQDPYRPPDVDVTSVLDEAVRRGVRGAVCVGTDAETSRQAVALAEAWRTTGTPSVGAGDAPRALGIGLWATVGLHPHEARLGTAGVAAVLEEVRASHRGAVVAVGECGLDYHYDHSPRSQQRTAFAEQIALAHRYDLALVVHARAAWDDTFAVLRSEGVPARTVFHCFTGGTDEATRCLELGGYLSFSGIVTFKNAEDVRAALDACPMERLLVETDAPFLAPAPHRGRQNRPAWVSVVGDAVAAVKHLPAQQVAEITASTTRAVFDLRMSP